MALLKKVKSFEFDEDLKARAKRKTLERIELSEELLAGVNLSAKEKKVLNYLFKDGVGGELNNDWSERLMRSCLVLSRLSKCRRRV